MDKGKLKKLNQLVARLAAEPGNEWMAEDLLKQISLRSDMAAEGLHPILLHIHEQCIEENIKAQAEEFYKDFPLTKIKKQLVIDFVKMEHERRRDDFENFCECAYQQIEGITNYLFEQLYTREIVGKHRNSSFYGEKSNFSKTRVVDELLNYYQTDSGTYKHDDQYLSNFFDSQNRVISNDQKYRWTFNNRFKSVLFVFIYDAKAVNFSQYRRFFGIVRKLAVGRNQTHRGGTMTDSQLADLNEITANSSQYYLLFYGFLSEFVRTLKFEESFLNRIRPKGLANTDQNDIQIHGYSQKNKQTLKIVDQITPEELKRRMKK